MTSNMNQPTRKRRAAAIAGVALLGAGLVGSSALFTDTEMVTDNTFTAGTFDLTAGQVQTAFDMELMLPGDTKSFDVTVGNGGSLDLRYAVEAHLVKESTAPEVANLGEALEVVITDSADTVLYTGAVGDLASATPVAVVGDKAEGAQAGDRDLAGGAPGETEDLTFTFTYPSDADNTHMGGDTRVNVAFFAEQTDNN